MQWSDVTRRPEPRMLRQFGGLCLLFGSGGSLWRASAGTLDAWTYAFGGLGLLGGLGIVWPLVVRWLYSGWMLAAFPIGWTVSRVVVATLFFAIFTPVAILFRMTGRDALRLRRPRHQSLWTTKPRAERSETYLRQY